MEEKRVSRFVGDTKEVTCACFDSSGRRYVTGGNDGVSVWKVGFVASEQRFSKLENVTSVLSFKSDKFVCAGSRNGSIKMYDLVKGKPVRTLKGHRSSVESLTAHPYGTFLVSGSSDSNVKVYDIRQKRCIVTYTGHDDTVNCVCSSPDGQWLASGSSDSTIKIWDLVAGKIVKTIGEEHTDAVNTLDFHPSDFVLVSGSSDRTTRFWNLDTFKHEECLSPETLPIRTVKYDRRRDGSDVVVGTDRTVKIWRRDEGFTTCISKDCGSWGHLMSVYCFEHDGDDDDQDPSMLLCSVEKSFVSIWKLSSVLDEKVYASKLGEEVEEEKEEEEEKEKETPKCDPHAKTMIRESKLVSETTPTPTHHKSSSKVCVIEDDDSLNISAFLESENDLKTPPRSMKTDRLSETKMRNCHELLKKLRVWWYKSNFTSRTRWLKIRDTVNSYTDTSVALDTVVILLRKINFNNSVDLSAASIVLDMIEPLLSDSRFEIRLVALYTTRHLVAMFKSIIIETLFVEIDSAMKKRNVNLMERREKCNSFCIALRRLRPEIEAMATSKQISVMRRVSGDIMRDICDIIVVRTSSSSSSNCNSSSSRRSSVK